MLKERDGTVADMGKIIFDKDEQIQKLVEKYQSMTDLEKHLMERISELEHKLRTSVDEKEVAVVALKMARIEVEKQALDIDDKSEIINVLTQEQEEHKTLLDCARNMYRARLEEIEEKIAASHSREEVNGSFQKFYTLANAYAIRIIVIIGSRSCQKSS